MGQASQKTERKVAWAAHPGGQQLVLSCTIQEILVEGNRGGGKTRSEERRVGKEGR